MAYPGQVAHMVREFIARWPGTDLTLHFHNTRGMGLANVLASIDAGARASTPRSAASAAAPMRRAPSGNVCSEEIAHALELMGYDTGTDVQALMAAARRLPALIGHDTPSQIAKAGRRLDLHPRAGRFRGHARAGAGTRRH
jgi:hydroxymethylglutaryl-CoA lyase